MPIIPIYSDIALLILRIGLGIVCILHGRSKFKPEFAKGIGVPYFFGFLSGVGMVAGGLGVLFGFLTQIAAIGPFLVMLGAVYHHKFKWKHPFFNPHGKSYEYAFMLVLVSLALILTGAGAYSIDAMMGLYP